MVSIDQCSLHLQLSLACYFWLFHLFFSCILFLYICICVFQCGCKLFAVTLFINFHSGSSIIWWAPVCACIYINLSLFYECFLPSRQFFFFKHLITIKYSTMLVELNCVRVSNFLFNCDQSQSSQHENYLIMVLIVELYFTSFFEHIYSFIFCDNRESCQFFTENIFSYLNTTSVLFLFFVFDVLLLYTIFISFL